MVDTERIRISTSSRTTNSQNRQMNVNCGTVDSSSKRRSSRSSSSSLIIIKQNRVGGTATS